VSLTERFEAFHSVLAIAEGLLFRKATAAKADDGAPGKSVLFSFCVVDREFPLDPNGSIVNDSNFRGHRFSRIANRL
jgi:hypothetical protein